jgi:hypothetical protein
MKKLATIGLALIACGSFATAQKVFEYPADEPTFSITFPEGWTVESEEEGSLSGAPEDELVAVELMALEAEEADGAITEAKEAFSDLYEEIEFDEIQEGELGNMKVKLFNAKGTDEEGDKYNINCALFAPKGGETFFMLFFVGSPEGSAKHAEALTGILQSMKSK